MNSTRDLAEATSRSPLTGRAATRRSASSVLVETGVRYLGYLFLVLFAAMFLVPFVYMVSISLRPNMEILTFPISVIPERPGIGAYQNLFVGTAIGNWLLNSFFVTAVVTVAQVFTSSAAGFAFARGDFPGRNFIFWLLMSAIMVPFTVTMIPLYILIARLGWVNSLAALIVPAAASIFGTFLCRQFILSIPSSYDEAAIIDGASIFGVYWRIHLPLMAPVLATLAVLTFLGTWNDFVWPMLVLQSNTQKTITLGLASMLSYTGGASIRMAGATLTFFPTLIVFIALQRYVIRGFMLSGVKG